MHSDINYIIQKSLKGDNNYIEILLKRLTPLIFKNIYKYYMPSDPLTEDLLQEGYIVILQSLKDYDIKRNVHFLRYVEIKLQYFFLNLFKEAVRHKTLSIEALSSVGKQIRGKYMNPLNLIILTEEKHKLYKCINKLSEKERTVIRLFYFDELLIPEISLKLNIEYRAVINAKSRAVKKLKKMLTNSIPIT